MSKRPLFLLIVLGSSVCLLAIAAWRVLDSAPEKPSSANHGKVSPTSDSELPDSPDLPPPSLPPTSLDRQTPLDFPDSSRPSIHASPKGSMGELRVRAKGPKLTLEVIVSQRNPERSEGIEIGSSHAKDGGFARLRLPVGVPLQVHLRGPWGAAMTRHLFLGPQESVTWDNIVLPEGQSFRGRVLLPDGRPAEGCRIQLTAPLVSQTPLCSAESDQEGHFEIGPIHPSLRPTLEILAHEGHGTSPFRDTEFSPNNPDSLSIRLESASRLGGRVFDQKQRPLEGVELLARSRSSKSTHSTQTDADGTFVFHHLRDGFYTIHARAKGFRDAVKTNLSTGHTAVRFLLTPRDLIEGDAPKNHEGSLDRFRIMIFRGEGPPSSLSFVAEHVFEDAESGFGFFLNQPLSDSFHLEFRADGYAPQRVSLQESGIQTEPHTWLVSAPQLPSGGVVEGRIVDPQGTPIVGAWVTSVMAQTRLADHAFVPHRRYPSQHTLSDKNGQFRLEGIEEGRCKVLIRAPEMAPRLTRSVEVEPGTTIAFPDLTLEKEARLSGFISNPSPLRRPSLELIHVNTGASRPLWLDSSFRFWANHLPSGTYTIRAYQQDLSDNALSILQHEPEETSFRVEPGMDTEIEFTF